MVGAGSVAALVCSFVLAKTGVYSSQIYKFELGALVRTLLHTLVHGAPLAMISVLLAMFWRIPPRIGSVPRALKGIGAVLCSSGLLYFATLLPRGVTTGTGYYLSPVFYMTALGGLILSYSAMVFTGGAPKVKLRLAVGASFLIAVAVGGYGYFRGIARQVSIVEVRDWMLTLPRRGAITIATNSPELAIRLRDLHSFHSTAKNLSFVSVTSDEQSLAMASTPDFYVVFVEHAPPLATLKKQRLLEAPLATVYRVR